MFGLLIIFMALISTNDIILVERDPTIPPSDVCATLCKKCVFATKRNLSELVAKLRLKRIYSAAVCGYECVPGNFVVTINGEVYCYGKDDRWIQYVFCYADHKKECKPCPPYPCYPRKPCPPYPCDPCMPGRSPSWCDPCKPKCPTLKFKKCCVDPCGRVTKRISGRISCYQPGPYYERGWD